MVLLGLFGLWFSLSGNYGLLMNEKFRWLTFSGSAVLLVLGVFGLLAPPKSSGINVGSFALLILMVLIGRPHLPNEFSMSQPEIREGMWEQVDQGRYPEKQLNNLSLKEADTVFANGSGFTIIGVVKRLESLDEHGSIALMSTFMYCCLADQFGTGFRVPIDGLDNYQDGQLVMVSGTLGKENSVIDVPNFRFGSAMFSKTNEDYFIQVDQVHAYDPTDRLPLLSELIVGGEKSGLFASALEKSGLLSELEKQGPYTVFLPVDEAMEQLEVPLDEMSARDIKNFARRHIISGRYFNEDLFKEEQVKSLNRESLKLEQENGKVKIKQSRLLFKDIEARNGVIHFIYPVLD